MRPRLGTLIGGLESTVGPKLLPTDEIPAPFFGRGPELAILRRALGAVRSEGQCRAVTLVGAAGIGKSRLIEEFMREVGQLDDPPVRVFRSSAPKPGSSWSSFTQLLAQRFAIADLGDLDEAKASVRAQMASVLDDRKVGDVLYLLGDLIDLEFPQSPLTKALEDGAPETEVLKRALFKSFLEADAAFGPMCFVLDDLHLCHDRTLSMLRFLVENAKAPVLFLAAARPELLSRHGALAEASTHSLVHLEPLTALDSAALIGSLLTPDGMTPMYLVEKARAITGGNPGRIEDLGRHYRMQGTLPPPSSSADAAVESRVEELTPSERLLLQKAAVMGGVFWLGGLIVLDRDGREPPSEWSAAHEPGLAELTDHLANLSQRDYIMRLPDSTFAGDEEYVFRHRVERDRIAALTNASVARKWHRLLADWLDSQPETRSHEEYLQLLAEQREKAGAAESAAGAYLEAAGQARAHASPKRELLFYVRALALLEDGHSRRLTALLRAAELLEFLGNPEAAFARYHEAASLAFRLNRRRHWETAHFSAERLSETVAEIEAKRRAEMAAAVPIEEPRRVVVESFDAAPENAAPASDAAPPDDGWLVDRLTEPPSAPEEETTAAPAEDTTAAPVEAPTAAPAEDAASAGDATPAEAATEEEAPSAEGGLEDAPADDQPTMLSAEDIRTDVEPERPPIVVVEPPAHAEPTAEVEESTSDRTETGT